VLGVVSLARGCSFVGVVGNECAGGDGVLALPLLMALVSFWLFMLSARARTFSFSATTSFSVVGSCAITAGISTLGAGVGPVPAGLLFLLLVLRASIGATSSTEPFEVIIAAISASLASFSFLFFLLAVSFLTFLFAMLGGGELARDTDAEVMEKVSTRSLIGVPG